MSLLALLPIDIMFFALVSRSTLRRILSVDVSVYEESCSTMYHQLNYLRIMRYSAGSGPFKSHVLVFLRQLNKLNFLLLTMSMMSFSSLPE